MCPQDYGPESNQSIEPALLLPDEHTPLLLPRAAQPSRPHAAPTSTQSLPSLSAFPLLLKASPLEAFGCGGEREATAWELGGWGRVGG